MRGKVRLDCMRFLVIVLSFALVFSWFAGLAPLVSADEGDGPPSVATPPAGCTTVITPATVSTQVWGASAGSKVCIQGGQYNQYLLLSGLSGTPENPVEVVNYAGVVEITASADWFGMIDVWNSRHFIINGKGDPDHAYGFKLVNNAGSGHGVHIDRRSTDYIIQGVEIAKSGFAGFMLRTQASQIGAIQTIDHPTAVDGSGNPVKVQVQPEFVLKNIVVRDNKITNVIHTTDGYGMLIGVPSFGSDPAAHRVENVRVYNNLIHNVGHNGLAIFGAVSDVRVYNNSITQFGAEANRIGALPATVKDIAGLRIGAGSTGLYYNNVIVGVEGAEHGAGIVNKGMGEVSIFNNLLVESGHKGLESKAGERFAITLHPAYVANMPFEIRYNTIVQSNEDGYGIQLLGSVNESNDHMVDHNLIVLGNSIHPAIADDNDQYAGVISENYDTSDIADVQFHDPAAISFAKENYALLDGSPAEGTGFLPGITAPADKTFNEATGWPHEVETEEPVEDPLDPQIDYETYVPAPVDFACSFIIPSNTTRDWNGASMSVSRISGEGESDRVEPGDIICIDGNDAVGNGQVRPISLRLIGMNGTAEHPVTIVNYGNVVTIVEDTSSRGAAVKIQNSKHVVFSGTGDRNSKYGFRLKSVGSGMMGISVEAGSTDVTLENIEVFGAGFAGIMMKTNPDGKNTAYNKENFTMENLIVRHNYVHDTGGEGMYIGHTSFHNGADSQDNGGNTVRVWPHAIKGLDVHDNIVERTGWDGMQVAAATHDVQVYNNIIRDYGTDTSEQFQANGLQIGPGSTGAYYNNIILDGHHDGSGINNQGRGDQIFFNNLIVNSNRSGIVSLPRITASMEEWHETNNSLYFINNTIINPATYGLHFYNDDEFYRGNVFYNNVVVKDGAASTDDYVMYAEDPSATIPVAWDLDRSHNLFGTSLGEIGFVNPGEGDYRLLSSSKAVDAGLNLALLSWAADVRFDLDGNSRPLGGGFDIGAYEYKPVYIPPYVPPVTPIDPDQEKTDDGSGEPGLAPQEMPKDVKAIWASEAVAKLAAKGALVLDAEGNFHPNQSATRAEYVDMLVKALGLYAEGQADGFKDTEGHWAETTIAIAAQLGLVKGYNTDTFGPDDTISRESMAVILARALELKLDGSLDEGIRFKDDDAISSWAADAVRAAAGLGLIKGYVDGTFQSQRPLSRSEAAVTIARIIDYFKK